MNALAEIPAEGQLPEAFRAWWQAARPGLPGHDDEAVDARRAAAFAAADALGLPNRRVEDWKFTSSHALSRLQPGPRDAAPAAPDWAAMLAGWPLDGAAVLVLADGAVQDGLSAGALPDGVTVQRLGEALPGLADLLQPLEGGAETTPANLNLALAEEGFLVDVAAGARPDRPLVLVHLTAGADGAAMHHLRHRLRLAEDAALTLVELHLSAAIAAPAWSNLLTDVELAPGAQLDHLRIGRAADGDRALRTGLLRGDLAAGSAYRATALALGGQLVRDEIDIRLSGAGASCRLDGLNLAAGNDHLDSTLRVAHEAGGCRSDQHYRAIADDHGHAVFQGRIAVAPDAQKSDAHQLVRALLLSDDAVADAKPELEILADDVQCSHGASIGDLDEEALFYLQARGIGRGAARNILIGAFTAEILAGIARADWRDAAQAALDRRLGAMVEGKR
ncbi:MAG: Fe-S cluster assembly protein SufD [Sneathiellaceae bacterium]